MMISKAEQYTYVGYLFVLLYIDSCINRLSLICLLSATENILNKTLLILSHIHGFVYTYVSVNRIRFLI